MFKREITTISDNVSNDRISERAIQALCDIAEKVIIEITRRMDRDIGVEVVVDGLFSGELGKTMNESAQGDEKLLFDIDDISYCTVGELSELELVYLGKCVEFLIVDIIEISIGRMYIQKQSQISVKTIKSAIESDRDLAVSFNRMRIKIVPNNRAVSQYEFKSLVEQVAYELANDIEVSEDGLMIMKNVIVDEALDIIKSAMKLAEYCGRDKIMDKDLLFIINDLARTH